MGAFTVQVIGLDKLAATVRDMKFAKRHQMPRALYAELNAVKNVSTERTPVLSGALAGSHAITEIEENSNSFTGSVVVGGPSAPYAVVVHEDLSVKHPGPHRGKAGADRYCGGQAKFLESAFNDAVPGFAQRVNEVVQLGTLE
jgi:hypothetical protein